MKVLYIFRSLAHWGGIERILVDKMNYFATVYGYDVYMLTTDQGCHPVPYQLSPKVHLEDLDINFYHQYRYGYPRRLFVGKRLEKLFERRLSDRLQIIKPDVIICTTANYLDIDVIARQKGHIPLIVESHSIYRMTLGRKGLRNRYADYMYRKGLSKAQMIVALTEGDANDWKKEFSDVCVIPNMVHLNDCGLSSLKNKRVIWVGRFDYQKRPMEAIRIWRQVYPQFPDWHLDIYGEGELRKEIEAMASLLNMNIHVHQPTDHIFDCYRNSSILISTSLFEPFGLVLPEAMSCGLPVIAYDCIFGPSVIIMEGKNGFLVSNNDRPSFVNRLCLLMENRSLRQQIGQIAQISSARFSSNSIMHKWEMLFQSLISAQ